MTFLAQLFRCCRQQQEPVRRAGQRFDELVSRAVTFEMMRLVHDNHVPARGTDLTGARRGVRDPVEAHDRGLRRQKRIRRLASTVFVRKLHRLAVRLVHQGERPMEAPEHLDEPLMHERLGHEHEHTRDLAASQQPVHHQPGFDRLAETHFVSEERARYGARRDLLADVELVREKLDAGAEKTPRERLPCRVLADQRAPPEVELPTFVPVATEEPLLGLAETERPRELGLGKAAAFAVVYEKSFAFVDVLDPELPPRVVLDLVADSEHDALDGRRAGCVLAYGLTRGKAHQHPAVRDLFDATETELGLRFADEALAHDVRRHGALSYRGC